MTPRFRSSSPTWVAMLAALVLALFALGASAQDARSGSAASTAGEPTIDQIYQAARAGNLDRADSMIDQVLRNHPNSAKAHYVKAELAAREGKTDVAKQELASAEKIAPGLPFAKAESVQSLRNQLASANNPPATTSSSNTPTRRMGAPADTGGYASTDTQRVRSFPWGTLAVVAAIVLIGIAVLRRRSAANASYGGAYGNTNAAPYGQTGTGPMYPPGGVNAGYPNGYGPGYPQGGYPQQPGMGSTLARGVGTGLAVGAGVVAAEELGRRMFGHGNEAHAGNWDPNSNNLNAPSMDQIDDGMRRNLNSDMGGNDFGLNDGGWDDAGGGGADFGSGDVGGGGSDWDT